MPVELRTDRPGEWVLALSGVVDIFDAADLAALARRAAAGPAPRVVVDCAEARAVDTSATQVLLALGRALSADGRELRVAPPPARVAAFWHVGGLDRLLVPETAPRT